MTDWHAATASTVAQARTALDWINHAENAETVALERRAIDRRLRRALVDVAKLDKAIDRPMCVGVFGPSQAGKSYLTSVLARQGELPLMVKFAGNDDVDFLARINPGGERESTGLVSRFSLRGVKTPEGYPVALRLLGEADIAKILANTFFLDGDQRKVPVPEPEALSALVKQLQARSTGAPRTGMTTEDVWDIQEYCEATFDGTRGVDALRGYWDEAARLAPQLGPSDRASLLEPLWGSLPQFTELYRQLAGALDQLGFATEAFCPLDALLPRENSIIDVQTLSGLGQPDQAMLEVRTGAGVTVKLPRPLVTALAAELHFEISRSPWPFFAHTDLLDFPGARGRQRIDLQEFLGDVKDSLKETFLRGKIAYLFDRYVAEQELTSMLLCVKPSNQDVTTLPDLIDNWISVTHGASPEERLKSTTVLFLVLTMFDMHFVDKAGEEVSSPGDRFASRMKSSISTFFGKAHKWPSTWTPGKPFDNSFWFRNPTIKAESIITYDGYKEVEFRADKVSEIATVRSSYLEVPAIQEHFRDPGEAFDAALKLNDGGVTYLAAKLAEVCRASLKEQQIANRLESLRESLADVLEPFHIASDINARLEERRAVSHRILARAQQLWQEGRFADLLAALQVSPNSVSSVVYEAFARRASSEARSGKPADAAPPAAAALPPIPGLPPMPGAPPLPGSPPAAVIPVASAEQLPAPTVQRFGPDVRLSRSAVEYWIGQLYTSAEEGRLADLFAGDVKLARELANELGNAVRRLSLDGQLASAIGRISGGLDEDTNLYLEKVTFAATALINSFVNRLGYDKVPIESRPTAPLGEQVTRPVYLPRSDVTNAASMPLEPSHHRYNMLSEWMYSVHRTIEENAMSLDGLQINVEQNDALGRIVMGLRLPPAELGKLAAR